MQAKEILEKARYTLSDEDKDRWSDKRLLSLLDDAILDIALRTTILVESAFYQVADLVVDIDLSDKVFKFLRAEYLDEPLPFYSFDEMDKRDRKWQLEEGTEVTALVYDKQKSGVLKQYPIVENTNNEHIEFNQVYGVTTHISYSDIQVELTEDYGDVSHIDDTGLIKFYYIRKHAKVTDINDTVYLADFTEVPIAHYITAMALRDNQDVQNRQMASEELQLYSNMIELHSIEKSQLFVRANHSARYRPND